MKILNVDKNKYIIYVPKYYYVYNESTINKYIDRVLSRLKKIYNVEVYSIFNIDCYIDNNYGIIIEIERIYDPFCMYSKKSDINLNIKNTNVLYEIEDYFICNNVYTFNNKYYIIPNNDIDILENIVNILYKDDAKRIMSVMN